MKFLPRNFDKPNEMQLLAVSTLSPCTTHRTTFSTSSKQKELVSRDIAINIAIEGPTRHEDLARIQLSQVSMPVLGWSTDAANGVEHDDSSRLVKTIWGACTSVSRCIQEASLYYLWGCGEYCPDLVRSSSI